jgi:hypothetical protein
MNHRLVKMLALLTLPLALVALPACSAIKKPAPKTQTEKALSYADDLKTAVDEFEASRKGASAEIARAAEGADATLKNPSITLRGAASDWEARWTAVKNRVQDLDTKLAQVGQKSLAYFNELDRLAGSISDRVIRVEEKARNDTLQTRWTTVFADASKDLARLKALVQKGDDFHKQLLLASLREKIAKNIEEAGNIAEQARSILKELERLTEEGRKLTVRS